MATTNPKLMIVNYYDSLIQQVDIYTEEQLAKYTDESVFEKKKKEAYNFDDTDSSSDNGYHYYKQIGKIPYEIREYMKSLPPEEFSDFDSDEYEEEEEDDDDDEDVKEEKNEEIRPDCFDLETVQKLFGLEPSVFLDPYSTKKNKYKYSKEKAKHEPPPLSSNVRKFLNNMRDELIGELKKGQEEAIKNYDKIKSELKVNKQANEEEFDRSIASRLFENKFMFLLIDNDSECKNQSSPFKMYLIVMDFYLNKHERKLLK